MTSDASQAVALRRLRIAVRGVVQGVGFRPFVYNFARRLELAGWVRNESDTVWIEVEGPADRVDTFVAGLRTSPPPQARLDALAVESIPPLAQADEGFHIETSQTADSVRPVIPADLATCGECRAEIVDPSQRRFRYPFTNCTNCGPRWSIIRQLPYDRPSTSMADFVLCPDCAAEYHDPADRRFHAQPVACPQCGPALTLLDAASKELNRGDDALQATVAAIERGAIVALKGLGGFQLLVDATAEAAVARLRQRKHRPAKPFAVMFRDVEQLQTYCAATADELTALQSPAAPIVLLRRVLLPSPLAGEGPGVRGVAPAVAPDNPYLGAMLPYTPLHHLLLAQLSAPVVCTSGNLAEEPMAVETAEAVERLGAIADLFLTHNRPIVRPVDDSVVQSGPAGVQILRRARGYAPLPIRLADDGPPVLAVGGHLKNTVALRLGRDVVLGAHVGDLDNVASVNVHRRAIDDLLSFFRTQPETIACDLHPDYASTRVAEELAQRFGVPLIRVQHHQAHVAAGMAEHHLAGPVLGLAWDGTGYGLDGTVWGGEIFHCDGQHFRRVAHVRPFGLPGGDKAAREPRRSLLGLLHAIDPAWAADVAAAYFSPAEMRTLLSLLRGGRQVPQTTSMGRLFDALAALGGLPPTVSFEGQAAMALQFAAEAEHLDAEEAPAYPLPLRNSAAGAMMADWEPLLRAALADRTAGLPIGRISARFHHALAQLAVDVADRGGCRQVVLGGGCFQNRLLATRCCQRLRAAGYDVYTHRDVPPGDGGIALGQILIATWQLKGR